ncbi:hypothetical protein MASR2M36_23760 [Providencia sp.]
MAFNKKILLGAFILAFSNSVFAKNICSVINGNADITQVFPDIDVPKNAKIGDVIASTGQFQKTIRCGALSSGQVQPYTSSPIFSKDDLVDNLNVRLVDNISCGVLKTDYPGLGVVWYNRNTPGWQCVSKAGRVERGLVKNNKVTITDVFYLVKTEAIQGNPEGFKLDSNYIFTERIRMQDNTWITHGKLYNIRLMGDAKIEPVVCKIKNQASESINFKTVDALAERVNPISQKYNIDCTGFIDNGATVLLNFDADKFAIDDNYFKSSDEGVGVKVGYSHDDKNYIDLLPSNNSFPVILNDNKGEIYLSISPYIKENSGIYPTSDSIDFKFNVKVK